MEILNQDEIFKITQHLDCSSLVNYSRVSKTIFNTIDRNLKFYTSSFCPRFPALPVSIYHLYYIYSLDNLTKHSNIRKRHFFQLLLQTKWIDKDVSNYYVNNIETIFNTKFDYILNNSNIVNEINEYFKGEIKEKDFGVSINSIYIPSNVMEDEYTFINDYKLHSEKCNYYQSSLFVRMGDVLG